MLASPPVAPIVEVHDARTSQTVATVAIPDVDSTTIVPAANPNPGEVHMADKKDDDAAEEPVVEVDDGPKEKESEFKDELEDDDDGDEFDDIDEDDFDDDFDDDFEEELDDDYEIAIDDEISAEFGLNTEPESEEDEDDDDLEAFEDFDAVD